MIDPIRKDDSIDEQVFDRPPSGILKPIIALKKGIPCQLVSSIHNFSLPTLRQRQNKFAARSEKLGRYLAASPTGDARFQFFRRHSLARLHRADSSGRLALPLGRIVTQANQVSVKLLALALREPTGCLLQFENAHDSNLT